MAHFFKGELKHCSFLALKKNAPSSASTVDMMTNYNIAHKVKDTPFHLLAMCDWVSIP
jgi:hypothetical protein